MLLRSVIALVAVACCLFAMQAAARFGFARLLGKYAVVSNSIPAADQAVSLAPADAAAEVLAAATWKLRTDGGRGAFRELVERLLRERGEWDRIIQEFSSGRPAAASI